MTTAIMMTADRFNAPLPYPKREDVAAGKDADEKRAELRQQAKLNRALEFLGKNWVLHPEYQAIPRHSPDLAVWWPHRSMRYTEAVARSEGRI